MNKYNTMKHAVPTFFLGILFLCAEGKSQPSHETTGTGAITDSAGIRPLKVGDRLPNLTFKHTINFPPGIKEVNDMRSRLVLLDFWSTGCSSCISAFPEMEALQEKFADSIQILVINPWETEENIHERFGRMKKNRPGIRMSALPGSNGDAIWKSLFPTSSVPH